MAWEHWGSKGVPVFPCSDDKRPLVKWREGASTDEETIIGMFAGAGARARHIGAAMGEVSGLFALDFDLYKGKTAKEYMQTLMMAKCLPPTRVHETKSGGVHYVYFVPDGVAVPRNSVPHDGVEVRGEGGYIIVPPSHGYSIQSSNTVDAPVSLVKRLARADAAFKSLSVSGLIQKVMDGSSFHEALTAIAAKMHSKGADPAEVIKTLHDAMNGSVAASPMHERHDRWKKIMGGKDGELARISTSAYRKYNPRKDQVDVAQIATTVSKTRRNRDVTVGGFFAKAPDKDDDGRGVFKSTDTVAVTVDTDNIDIDEFPFERSYTASAVDDQDNKSFLIYPLIMEGDVVVLTAEPKAGKTLTSMNMCLHAAAGIPIGGDLTPLDKDGNAYKVPIIYFALEGQGVIRKRIKAWLNHQKNVYNRDMTADDLRIYIVERPLNLASEEAKQEIVDKMMMANLFFKNKGWGGIGLTVFDTLTKAMPGKDQNSVEDTSEVFNTVDMMREVDIDCAVMFVHHNNRQSKAPRGSSNIMAEPDTILSVSKIEPAIIDDVQYDCIELSVYMARSIDDAQTYRFATHEVEIGINTQGIMEKAPVLEMVEDYDAKLKPTDASLRKSAARAKEAFYKVLWETLADAPDCFLTFGQLARKLNNCGSDAAAGYYNSHLNGTGKEAAVNAWKVLSSKNNVPATMEGMTFNVTDNGVAMSLDIGSATGMM